jgi:hypothetical protein
MKVSELLKALEGVDPSTEVIVFADHHGHYGAYNTWNAVAVEEDSETFVFDPSDDDDMKWMKEQEYVMPPYNAFVIEG